MASTQPARPSASLWYLDLPWPGPGGARGQPHTIPQGRSSWGHGSRASSRPSGAGGTRPVGLGLFLGILIKLHKYKGLGGSRARGPRA